MSNLENPHAGQGPVLLDIGGTVGALVVTMPASTDGLEVEMRPVRRARPTRPLSTARVGPSSSAPGEPTHHHQHHAHAHIHVGVVARPTSTGTVHALVYPSVEEGDYSLHPLPDGPAVLTVRINGGTVTDARWPD